MTDTSPPPEAQRFGRSQTPESPRPVHIPEPSNIPVLLNQMDPVFNDTATYNIPHNQTFSPYSDSARAVQGSYPEEQNAVQNFLRGAEQENARFGSGAQFSNINGRTTQNDTTLANNLLSALANTSVHQASESHANTSHNGPSQAHTVAQSSHEPSAIEANANARHQESSFQTGAEKRSEPDSTVKPNTQSGTGGVDYQSLLDTISQSASTAPVADSVSAPTTASHADHGSSLSLPPIPGLPPKPPVQATPQETANHYAFPTSTSDLREQYQSVNHDALQVNGAQPSTSGAVQSLHQNIPTQAPGSWDHNAAQVSPTNPMASFVEHPHEHAEQADRSRSADAGERPWTPRTQGLYDQFLEEERRYVTEGIWDRFPPGSRLFVGNLASEKVTKRDLFHVFHKHGRLAQISIKQAYGFVQYLEASSCQAALQAEQASEIRGRKIHLEVSKPQKNTRNQAQGNKRRRSRSPDRGAGRQADRHGRSNFNGFRDERNRRDDYRPARSPSPRTFRQRDDYHANPQSPRFSIDSTQRSPYSNNFPPAPAAYDEEANLPLPRRDPREVPDVQILILEPSVAQSFINWIEQGFRAKGLRASTIWLSPRLPLGAVVKRQIIEGVQAVVKLTQGNQYNSRIPLQVFDRSIGASNVNFNEYVDLDVSVAADIVLHARQKERGAVPPTPQTFPPPQSYPQAQYGHPPPPQYPPQMAPAFPQHNPPQLQYAPQPPYQAPYQAPVTPTSTAPNLQQLLANLRQPGDAQSGLPQGERSATNLTSLLANPARQQGQAVPYPPQPVASTQYHVPQQQSPTYGNNPAYATGQQPQQNVQNIMDTLARYNR